MTITFMLGSAKGVVLAFVLSVMFFAIAFSLIDKSYYPKIPLWTLLKPNIIGAVKGMLLSFVVIIMSIIVLVNVFDYLALHY